MIDVKIDVIYGTLMKRIVDLDMTVVTYIDDTRRPVIV